MLYNDYKTLVQEYEFAVSHGFSSATINAIEHDKERMQKDIELLKPYANRIKQAKDGRWYVNYTVSKGKYSKIIGTTPEAVEQELLSRLKHSAQKVTVSALFERYLDTLTLENGSTAVKYKSDYKRFLASSSIVDMDVVTMSVSDLKAELVKMIRSNHMTRKDYNNAKTVLNAVLDMAVDDKIITSNPARSVRKISRDAFEWKETGVQVFSEDESEKIVLACKEFFDKTKNPAYMAVVMNFVLGLRVGELSALKVSDFDFDAHLLHVQRSEKDIRVAENGNLKHAGVRVVPYLKMGIEARSESIDMNCIPALVKFVCGHSGGSEWLFTRQDGTRTTSRAIAYALKSVNDSLCIAHRSNHKIRKTVISKMIQSGLFSTTDVRVRAGHRDFRTTQRYYAHPLTDSKMADKIGTALVLPAMSEFV